MEVFNELYYFDIFLHIDVLEFFKFNHTKVKTTLSNMHRINCGNFLPLDFWILTILDDQLFKAKTAIVEEKNYLNMNNAFILSKIFLFGNLRQS